MMLVTFRYFGGVGPLRCALILVCIEIRGISQRKAISIDLLVYRHVGA
jgi:hypothetical protein